MNSASAKKLRQNSLMPHKSIMCHCLARKVSSSSVMCGAPVQSHMRPIPQKFRRRRRACVTVMCDCLPEKVLSSSVSSSFSFSSGDPPMWVDNIPFGFSVGSLVPRWDLSFPRGRGSKCRGLFCLALCDDPGVERKLW